MLALNVDRPDVSFDYNGNVRISFSVLGESRKYLKTAYDGIKEKPLRIEIKDRRKSRTMDANAYLWVLMDGIADKIGSTKEEVYRTLVQSVGQFEIFPVKADKAEEVIRMWSGRGLGWHAEIIDDSKLDGYKKGIFYFGSSVYDGQQMARLIDEAISEAEGLGIPTLPDTDIRSMKERWCEKQTSKSV